MSLATSRTDRLQKEQASAITVSLRYGNRDDTLSLCLAFLITSVATRPAQQASEGRVKPERVGNFIGCEKSQFSNMEKRQVKLVVILK